MDNKIKRYIEYRLKEWASWYRQQLPNLGYPNLSNEGRLMIYGPVRLQTSTTNYDVEQPQAESIDMLLIELAVFDENTAKVIKTHYMLAGTQRDKAQSLNMAVTQYKVYLNMATSWLAGVLREEYSYEL